MEFNQVNRNAGNVINAGPQWYDEKNLPPEPGLYYWECTRPDGFQSPGFWYWDKEKERQLPSTNFGVWRVYGPIPGAMPSLLDDKSKKDVML